MLSPGLSTLQLQKYLRYFQYQIILHDIKTLSDIRKPRFQYDAI